MVGNRNRNRNRPVDQSTRLTPRVTIQPSGRLHPIEIPLAAVTSNCVTLWNRINFHVDLGNSRPGKVLRRFTVTRFRPH